MNFKDFYNLNEAFDKPYEFDIDSSDQPLTVYTFNVSDVDIPYSIEVTFDLADPLDQFIEPKRDSNGRAWQTYREALQSADQYIASKYPNASKISNVDVFDFAFNEKESGTVSKTGKGGHNATRIIGTIISIAEHYVINNKPTCILFTGAKAENRGSIYTKLTKLVFRTLKNTSLNGYSYYIDSTEGNAAVKFWIYKEDDIPYLGDDKFHQRLINQWQQQNPGLDNVYENDMS